MALSAGVLKSSSILGGSVPLALVSGPFTSDLNDCLETVGGFPELVLVDACLDGVDVWLGRLVVEEPVGSVEDGLSLCLFREPNRANNLSMTACARTIHKF